MRGSTKELYDALVNNDFDILTSNTRIEFGLTTQHHFDVMTEIYKRGMDINELNHAVISGERIRELIKKYNVKTKLHFSTCYDTMIRKIGYEKALEKSNNIEAAAIRLAEVIKQIMG